MILYIKTITLKMMLLAKWLISKGTYFLKEHSWRWRLSILFPVLSIIVSVIIDSYIWNKIRKKRCSMKKGVPKTFAKFTGKHLCQSLFFNKASGLRPATLKKRIWQRCFPVKFAKFLRTSSLDSTSGRLLLSSNPMFLD